MIFTFVLGLAALLALGAAQYQVDPPTTAAPDTIKDCTWWQVASSTDTCLSISENSFITLEQFYTYVRFKLG